MHRLGRKFEKEVSRALSSMNIESLSHPVLPDLFFRPDFLFRKNGKLFTLELAQWRQPHTIPRKALRLLEELFEIKLSLGNDTISSLLILGSPETWSETTLSLLKTFYEYVGFIEQIVPRNIHDRITEILSKGPKDEFYRLWDSERKYREEVDFEYPLDYLKEFKYNPEYRTMRPRYNPILQVLEKKLNLRNIEFRSVVRFPCLITDLIPKARFRLYFDLFAQNCLIKTLNVRPESAFAYHKIRELLIRGRLLRYRREGDEIIPIEDSPELILVSNGFLVGPPHDADRYLLMLTDVGWRVFPSRRPDERWEVVDYIAKK